MNGKIDEAGVLFIERAGRMVKMECPHRVNIRSSGFGGDCFASEKWICSHACAAFGEPVKENNGTETGRIELSLCREARVLVFDKFTDERVYDEGGTNA